MQRIDQFEQLARGLGDATDETTRLQLAAVTAVQLVAGCDHAGVTVNENGSPRTRAASDDVVRRANQLQYEFGEGPCLDTLRDEETLVSTDLAADPRWPHWAPKVQHELGAGSMISLLLYTKKGSYGALSLYGDRPHAFDAEDLAVAQVLAGHLAVSMAAGREIDQRGVAIASRTIIGQAEGILMERFGLDADQAFGYLRRVSSNTNRKLAQVAEDLVRTRELPDGQH
jgi:GAF domain-containing protein